MSDDADDSITFRVNNKCHPDFVIFKIRKSTKLIKMISAYAKRYGVKDYTLLHFTFNGKCISESDTAESICIEDNGHIDCSTPSDTILKSIIDLCASDSLSLNALKEKINLLNWNYYDPSSLREMCEDCPYLYVFFHLACLNKKITLEIINYLLEVFPEAASYHTGGMTPLHCACYNQYCHSSIIELLVKKNPEFCKMKGKAREEENKVVEGLPLYCYLIRKSNIDINTVKILAEDYHRALTLADYIDGKEPVRAVLSNPNINDMQDILEYLLYSEPPSVHNLDGSERGAKLLSVACKNEGVTLEIVHILLNAWPEAIRTRVYNYGRLPIHHLCRNDKLDDDTSLKILQCFLAAHPTLMRERDIHGDLPIHSAVCYQSIMFCRALVNAHPESLKEGARTGYLPIHFVCCLLGARSRIDVIQYILEEYPESINVVDSDGYLPIHHAALYGNAKKIELLLKHDATSAMKETADERLSLPLYLSSSVSDSNVCQVLFDSYPEAINIRNVSGKVPLDLARERGNQEIVNFLQTQLVYVTQAQDAATLSTPDSGGYLPLHRALIRGDASLGSIKLLVRAYPGALQVADQEGILPLHTACYHATVDIVKFIVDTHNGLNIYDDNNDYPLHHACRGANLGVVKYLMETSTSGVSKTNANDKLPFHLLLEYEDEQVHKTLEFTEACFHLLRAHPETVMMMQTASRKRKRG